MSAEEIGLPEVELSEDGKNYTYDGQPYERVTNIVSAAMPPYLAPWAEQVGQKAMWEVMTSSAQSDGKLPHLGDARQEIREQKLTIEDEKDSGGDRGSALHQAIEAMILTGSPSIDLSDFENPEHRLYAQSFAQFMVDYQPTFEVAEVRVVHPELRYAGTFDAIATCHARPKGARGMDLTGKRIILDWKTNKAKKVYTSHLYQLAAYQLAMQRWKKPVDGAAVVAVGPYGKTDGKKSYSFKANHVEPVAFQAMVEWRRVVARQASLNPLARKK